MRSRQQVDERLVRTLRERLPNGPTPRQTSRYTPKRFPPRVRKHWSRIVGKTQVQISEASEGPGKTEKKGRKTFEESRPDRRTTGRRRSPGIVRQVGHP